MKSLLILGAFLASTVAFAGHNDDKITVTEVSKMAYNAYDDAVDAGETLEAMIDAASEYGDCTEKGNNELVGLGKNQVKAWTLAPVQYIVTNGPDEMIYWRPRVKYSCKFSSKD